MSALQTPPCGAKIALFSHSMCPFAQRALIGLNLAGKPFNIEQIDLYGHKPSWFLAMNPKGQVPVLRHNENIVLESEDILDYICSNINEDVAADTEERLWWRESINGSLLKAGKDAVYAGRADSKLTDLLRKMDSRTGLNDGPFLAGSRATIVDASAFPFIYRLNKEFGLSGCENLSAWLTHVSSIEEFSSSVAEPWWWWW
jgi:glutathione S-transferase